MNFSAGNGDQDQISILGRALPQLLLPLNPPPPLPLTDWVFMSQGTTSRSKRNATVSGYSTRYSNFAPIARHRSNPDAAGQYTSPFAAGHCPGQGCSYQFRSRSPECALETRVSIDPSTPRTCQRAY